MYKIITTLGDEHEGNIELPHGCSSLDELITSDSPPIFIKIELSDKTTIYQNLFSIDSIKPLIQNVKVKQFNILK